MDLHISRPALIEAFARQGKDITKATPQEMRSLVCAQCHVEYYFKGDGKYLTFPWDKGMTVEAMEQYYDENNFSDYTHALSRAPIIKAQHPDYEISQLGIHGQRGVSCADCHMPYKSEGGLKFSDHHIQSPLAMIDRTCQVCHRESEETLRNNVYERQRKANEIRNRLEKELASAHIEAKFAWDKGATETEMKPVLKLLREAQWRWDFGVASHGAAFHAPQEIQRILSHGLDRALQARLSISKVLAKHGYTDDVPMPDISTKDKAQKYIGLDIPAEKAAKERFMNTTVPGGIMTCGGLIVIGLILHLFTGGIDWDSFAWPLNICVLAIYVVAIIVLYILRKKVYFVRWAMSYKAAVPSLVAVVFLTFLMGMIRQVPASVHSGDVSAFNRMLSFWPFILV